MRSESSRETTPGPDRILALIAPALLVIVALFQVWRVHAVDQSSWSGAGFGMFATIDNEITRIAQGFAVGPDGDRLMPLPTELERAAFELQVVPTEDRARSLAQRWQRLSGTDGRFAVEVWRVRFDPDTSEVTIEAMRRVVVE